MEKAERDKLEYETIETIGKKLHEAVKLIKQSIVLSNHLKSKPKGEQIILKIEGMHCVSCAMNVDGELEDLEGVASASTSYAKSEVKVVYDSEKVGLTVQS